KAEVSETGSAFAVLRQAGFSVYARQEIWQRAPGLLAANTPDVLRPETDQDAWAINSLFGSVVPRLVLQANAVPEIGHGGLVYECAGQVLAYVTVQEGKCGLYIQSVIHPDVYDQSRLIIGSMLARVRNAERLPAYFAVRRYQEWLHGPLAD